MFTTTPSLASYLHGRVAGISHLLSRPGAGRCEYLPTFALLDYTHYFVNGVFEIVMCGTTLPAVSLERRHWLPYH